MEVPRLGVESELWPLAYTVIQQLWVQALSATYITAHNNARSLTHWARLRIEPASSGILVWFITTEPQGEFHKILHLITSARSLWHVRCHIHWSLKLGCHWEALIAYHREVFFNFLFKYVCSIVNRFIRHWVFWDFPVSMIILKCVCVPPALCFISSHKDDH